MSPPSAEESGFSKKEIRQKFVRKVYTILSLQLTVTTAFILYFSTNTTTVWWVHQYPGILVISYIVFISSYFAILCCGDLRRKYPFNLIILSVYTLALSFMTGVFTTAYKIHSVMLALLICAICCTAVTLFSFSADYDLTSYAGVQFVIILALVVFGFILTFRSSPLAEKIHAGIGAVAFMASLALDTQKIMGGKKIEISPEEHVYAAIVLYMDMIQIFWFFLRLAGERREANARKIRKEIRKHSPSQPFVEL